MNFIPKELRKVLIEGTNAISHNPSIKQSQVIQCEVPLPPDEINDTYIDINKELQMNINVYSGLTILDFRI